MQSGLGWKFMAGAPRPVVRPAQPQHLLQPVLELSDTAGIEAVARGFFTESPAPIAAEVNPVPTLPLPLESAINAPWT